MTDSSDLNEEFNSAIDEFLPENVDPTDVDPRSESDPKAPEADKTEHKWAKVLNEWHALQSVDEYRCDELAKREIEHYAEELDLPASVNDMAKQIFDQYLSTQDHLVIELTAAAAVYSAAKVNEVSITPDALVDVKNEPLDRTILLRQSKELVSELGLDPEAFFNTDMYVDDYCEELELSKHVNRRAKQILDHCNKAGISGGKSPTGWAASAVYLASIERNSQISQDAVANVANVSTVTIRNRYTEQREVVVKRECPDEIEEIVEWVCDRVDLPDSIREDAKAIAEADPDVTIPGQHDINPSFSEDPLGWAMAAVKVAADNREYDLIYRPLKNLSGYKAENLKPRVRVIKKSDEPLRDIINKPPEEGSAATDPEEFEEEPMPESGATPESESKSDADDSAGASSPTTDPSEEPGVRDRTATGDSRGNDTEIPESIISTIEELDDDTLQALQSVISEEVVERRDFEPKNSNGEH